MSLRTDSCSESGFSVFRL